MITEGKEAPTRGISGEAATNNGTAADGMRRQKEIAKRRERANVRMVHVQVMVGVPSAGTTYADHVAGQIADLHMKPTIPHITNGIKRSGSLEIPCRPKMSGAAQTNMIIGGEIKPVTQQRDQTRASAGRTCVALATELRVDFLMNLQVISWTMITGIATAKPILGILHKIAAPMLGIHSRQNQILIHGIKRIIPLLHLQYGPGKPVCILGKATARKAILVHCCTFSRTRS